MAAIVKANANLTNGGLAIIRRSFGSNEEGVFTYEVEYCCLARFVNNHIGKFKLKAAPPTQLPSGVLQFRLPEVPKLYEFSHNIINGLCYFTAKYSTTTNEGGEVIFTTSSEQRSYSGSVNAAIYGPGNFGSTVVVASGVVPISYDYISITENVSSKDPRNLPAVRGRVGPIFNRSVGLLGGRTPTLEGGQGSFATVESESVSKSSRGTYTYTASSTGVYQ